MFQPKLDADIGLWLSDVHAQEDKFNAVLMTVDGIAAVVVIAQKDIQLSYEDTLLSRVMVTPHKINFIDKAFEDLDPDKRPKQFEWDIKPPTKAELAQQRQSGTHPRRIWMLHPGRKVSA